MKLQSAKKLPARLLRLIVVVKLKQIGIACAGGRYISCATRPGYTEESTMRAAVFKMICRFLIASLTMMSFTASAGMIGADQLAASSPAQLDRAAVLALLDRPEVVSQLQAQGLDPQVARERVASMSDSEVQALNGQIESLPAGAKSNGWVIAAVVVVAIIIWYLWMK